MFVVASFSVAAGIGNSTKNLERTFTTDYYLITLPGEHGMDYIEGGSLARMTENSAWGTFLLVQPSPSGKTITLFSIEDPNRVLPSNLSTAGDEVLAGSQLSLTGNLTIGSQMVTVAGKFSSSMFPNEWLLGSPDLLHSLSGNAGSNFVISKGLSQTDVSNLRSEGFSVEPMVGIIEFLKNGVGEIERDMWWFLLPSSFVTAVLAYSFVGSETADKRHEIGVLKTIGAGRRKVLSYLLADAAIISAWGGVLGLALGICLSYGISTLASTMFGSIFIIRASEALLLVSFIATVLAGTAGSLIPALKMTWSSPVEDLREVSR